MKDFVRGVRFWDNSYWIKSERQNLIRFKMELHIFLNEIMWCAFWL